MVLTDQVKNYARKLVETRPTEKSMRAAVRPRKPLARRFKDDGIVPNHPRWPIIVYRNAISFDRRLDPAALIDRLFDMNGWGRSWRDTIYDFVHYHSQTHEVLGVARGNGVVEFGGVKGRRLSLRAGDVVILPAGTGHRLIESSKNFQVVGAYPSTGTYDECTDSRDRPEAVKRIARVRKPGTDPLYGTRRGVAIVWKR